MTRAKHFQRLVNVAASLGVIVLLLAAGLPHHHDGAAVSHPSQSCRICKIQDGFAATMSSTSIGQDRPMLVARLLRPSVQAPRTSALARSLQPRAPPVLS